MNTLKTVILTGLVLALAIGMFLFRGEEVELITQEVVILESKAQAKRSSYVPGESIDTAVKVNSVPVRPTDRTYRNRDFDREYERIEIAYGQFFATVGEELSREEIEEIKTLLVETNLDKLEMYSGEVGMNIEKLTAYHVEIDEFDRKSGEGIQSLMSENVGERFHRYRQTLPYRNYMEIVSKRMSSKGYSLNEETYEAVLNAIAESGREITTYLGNLSLEDYEPEFLSEEGKAKISKQVTDDLNAIGMEHFSSILEPEALVLFLELYYPNRSALNITE